jgi:hypothetical protein
MAGFQKAVRSKAKLRLALTGPSGSGKTWGALLLAAGLGGRIAVIDTEQGSSALYAGEFEFDVLTLGPPYKPERFVDAIKQAVADGYGVIVVDGITPQWSGSGGCLELNDETAKVKFRGNTWSAWSETTPRHRAFVEAMLQVPAHLVVTVRSKTETAQVEEGGRKAVKKIGMKAETRDGVEYEFTTVLDLIHDGHYATVSKDRSGLFSGKDPEKITVQTGIKLREWLESGAAVAPEAAATGMVALTPADPLADRADLVNLVTLAESIGMEKNELSTLAWKLLGKAGRDFTVSDVIALDKELRMRGAK